MRRWLRVVLCSLTVVCCFAAVSLGIASVLKFVSDDERFDTIAAFGKEASCRLTATVYDYRKGDCIIQSFNVELRLQATEAWAPGYSAFSNFFSDVCGGLVFHQNVSLLGDNQTLVPCWYRSINDSTVRLVPTAMFAPAKAYLYAGVVLTIFGAAGPAIALFACCVVVGRCVSRRCRLIYSFRRSIHRSAFHRRRAFESFEQGSEEAPPIPDIAEVRPVGADWAGRLICANDFATAAAMRLQESLRLARLEECPLCFRRFDVSVVWWTCGHYVCDECNPKVLDAERRWGHTNNPRCPLCRERSDIEDIVKIVLASGDVPSGDVPSSGEQDAAGEA